MRAAEYFYNNDILGMVLTNVQDVLKAHDLGLSIMTENEDYLDERYDEEIDNNRDATTDEIIEDAQTAFKVGGKLYATLDVPTGYEVIPRKATTLQSQFRVGQEVYTMDKNKIVKANVEYISLASGDISQNARLKEASLYDTAEYLYYAMNPNRNTMSWETKKRMMDLMKDFAISNFALVKTEKGDTVKRAFGDLFATKEELVKHLMEEE